jgi:hypothetical protein
MMPVPEPEGIREFLNELGEVAERRHLHLEVADGQLVAVGDRPGTDPVPVQWDEDLKRYSIGEVE